MWHSRREKWVRWWLEKTQIHEDHKLLELVGCDRPSSYPDSLLTRGSPSPRSSFSPSPLTCECNINALQAHEQTDMGCNARCTEGFVGCVGVHSTHEPFCTEVHSCREGHTVGGGAGKRVGKWN